MLFASTLYFDIMLVLALALLGDALPQPITARSNSDLSLTAQLRLADTAIERYQLLPNDSDFVFNFADTEDLPVATSQNWPALVGVGAAFSMSQLPACSMSFLHLHPRATELFALTSGHVLSEMVPQAGVLDNSKNSTNKQRVIRTDLRAGQVTIYPAGSFHTQVNPDCEAANFTAAFNSDEFAVSLVAEQLFAFSDGVVERTFGGSIAGEDVERVRSAIPVDMAIKVEECLVKCGLGKR
ncbi:spherulin [Aspergillus sclerotiicarbonarius CBS 121057]|uniref:Spherulin n=1 Tax=Aspergillus sclerotiicarbonarius (strain CBS 121057 / IBT 28362) TaxID=1448318 RepID=A0A319EPC4_ASPSB|nr:spherulin [Aspergillus sclerotiicarbonarius CBS 121057]